MLYYVEDYSGSYLEKKPQTDYTLKIGIFHHRVIVKVGENIHAVKGTSSHDPAAAARGG